MFDVHVASPNGVSNHLLVEASRPPDQTTAPPRSQLPVSAYSVSPKTPTLNVTYLPKDASGNSKPTMARSTDSTPNIDIVWSDLTGTAPEKIQVTLNLSYAGGFDHHPPR